jgi:hypothetical protein
MSLLGPEAAADPAGAANTDPAWQLPVKSFTFLAINIAVALGLLAGSRRLALRLAGKAAVGAAVAILQAVVDSRTMRRGRCGLSHHE